jgi:hypothetical protein
MTVVLGTIGVVMCNRIFRGRNLRTDAASAGERAAAVDLQGET